MTNSEQAIREKAINIFADIFTAGGEAHEVGGQSFDQLQQSGYIDRKITDLTALISEHYYPKEKYDELLQQRDELKEALILAEGLIDMASDKEWAKIRAAIKNTETK